jgi:hypothetical protein
MNSVYIYTHLGLGDNITANGLVRTVADNYDRVYVFCKPHNIKNVAYMYRDLNKIKIIAGDDLFVRQFMSINKQNNYLIVGHEKFWEILKSPSNTKTITEIFYEMSGIPWENMWSKFYVKRDLNRENEIFKKLGLSDKDEYIFVHDDHRKIYKNIPNDIKIIRPINKEYNIFEFLTVIEKAKEVHVINSSFFCMLWCMNLNKQGLFLHEYSRPDLSAEETTPNLNINWKIVK